MKTFRKYFALASFVLAGMVLFSACNEDNDAPQPINPIEDPQSIVEIASGNSNFSTLVAALQKADLVNALSGDGPFTVFAPTNEAFQMLFNDLGVSGLDDLPALALRPILLYHVLGVEAKSSSLSTGYANTLNTFAPDNAAVSAYVEVMDGVMINSTTKVTSADVEATNGVIHIIDKVLVPPTVVDFAIWNDNFSILVEAVVKAGLVEALSADGPFTIFAPTNEAFEALFAELNVSGIQDLSAEALTPILLYHVVADNVRSNEVASGMVPTLNESAMLDISTGDRGVTINGNTSVVAVDVQGTNGVIHVIDKVLLP
jgi:transforming growth factor-beta-induced protein